MRILTRYVLRAHVGPFLFAFTALTGLLFLNAVAQRMENLVGKGLSADVILDFLVLSLPHTIALTLPMSVLVAVLYAFSELTANSELIAMSAGGVRPERLVLPVAVTGLLLTGGMFLFNDRVLPEANHRLRNLIADVSLKSPTFNLEERVINTIETEGGVGKVYLEAARIDNTTGRMWDVVLYDLSDPTSHRTTYADSAVAAFNRAQTDLYLTLYDGTIHEVANDREGGFTRSAFRVQIVPLRGVGNELERHGERPRRDREMTIAMMKDGIRAKKAQIDGVRDASLGRSLGVVATALGRPPIGVEGVDVPPPPPAPANTRRAGVDGPRLPPPPRDEVVRGVARDAAQSVAQIESMERSIRELKVEIHKKFSIAVACFVFTLIGAPLAVRSHRGGLGTVIAISVAIFAVYWAGLIGGERLADRGVIPPWFAMWVVDAGLFVAGALLLSRMARDVVSTRSGAFEERVTAWVDRMRRRFTPAGRRTGEAAA
ncbi:MAG: YjgP/YjgQ family permease [Gemmatimonadetes bacterium]|nr:MAG: YjgP/YjgQ family permease [Gemmatimonadota bacterium]